MAPRLCSSPKLLKSTSKMERTEAILIMNLLITVSRFLLWVEIMAGLIYSTVSCSFMSWTITPASVSGILVASVGNGCGQTISRAFTTDYGSVVNTWNRRSLQSRNLFRSNHSLCIPFSELLDTESHTPC